MAQSEHSIVESISITDMVIAVLGVTGSGKTSLISSLVGHDVGIGHALHSETTAVSVHSFVHRGSGKRVFLIDTPGFNDTNRDDVDVFSDITFILAQMYRNSILLSGIIYVHDITTNRVKGSHVKMLNVFRAAVGQRAFPYVTLLSSKWQTLQGDGSWIRGAIQREEELRSNDVFWGSMCRAGAKIHRWDGSTESALSVVDEIEALQGRRGRPTLQIQAEMSVDGKLLKETSAGKIVMADLLEQEQKFQQTIAELRHSYNKALEKKNRELVAQLEEQSRQFQLDIETAKEGQRRLLLSFDRLSKEKLAEYGRKMARVQGEIKRLAAKLSEKKTSRQGYSKLSAEGEEGEGEAGMRREHSRLMKLQLTLSMLGILAGVGMTIAGGVTVNPVLLATGISVIGGSVAKASDAF